MDWSEAYFYEMHEKLQLADLQWFLVTRKWYAMLLKYCEVQGFNDTISLLNYFSLRRLEKKKQFFIILIS